MLLPASTAGPALARVVEGFTLSDEQRFVQKTYPAFPDSQAPDLNPIETCRESQRCDYMIIRFRPGRAQGHLTTFRLTWPGPSSNNLDWYLYDATDTLVTQSAGNRTVEEKSVTDLPSGDYQMLTYNKAGRNFGYTWAAELRIGRAEDSTPGPVSTPQPTPASGPTENPSPQRREKPSSGLLASPPIDGTASRHELDAVAADKQAKPVSSAAPALRALILALVIAAVAGSTVVFLRIRRDRA